MLAPLASINHCPRAGVKAGDAFTGALIRPLPSSASLPTCLALHPLQNASTRPAPRPRGPAPARADPHASPRDTNGSLAMVEAIDRADHAKFVRFLHLASPYVVGHRSRTFVIVLPGELIARRDRLARFLEDVLLLHGLGVRLVLVAGAKTLIDEALTAAGRELQWDGAYRVTDDYVMKVAVEAAGTISTEIAAQLSRAPSIPMMRRHSRGEGRFHFAPAVQVVSGNYVTAKRRGIVGGVDFGAMGQVRFVQRDALRAQLDAGNIVLLTNIGVSAAGELLNCNAYDVATHAAVELGADKMLILTGPDVRKLKLPQYLPLDDAEALIRASIECDASDSECLATAAATVAGRGGSHVSTSSMDDEDDDGEGWTSMFWRSFGSNGNGSFGSNGNGNGNGASSSGVPGNGNSSNGNGNGGQEMVLDLDGWQQIGFPNAVLVAVVACRNGVNRAHLVDMERDGAMLLELYTRDGINGVCMIAADLYEGIRPADANDAAGVARLLRVLGDEGHALPFPPDAAVENLSGVTVLEREGRVLACCVCRPLGDAPDGVAVAEIAAFVVEPSVRRQGLGDSLLDYVEQGLRRQGYRRVVLIAGQGSSEWFCQRNFESAGDIARSTLIPPERAAAAPAVAKLYAKPILELDAALDAPAGKRIGF